MNILKSILRIAASLTITLPLTTFCLASDSSKDLEDRFHPGPMSSRAQVPEDDVECADGSKDDEEARERRCATAATLAIVQTKESVGGTEVDIAEEVTNPFFALPTEMLVKTFKHLLRELPAQDLVRFASVDHKTREVLLPYLLKHTRMIADIERQRRECPVFKKAPPPLRFREEAPPPSSPLSPPPLRVTKNWRERPKSTTHHSLLVGLAIRYRALSELPTLRPVDRPFIQLRLANTLFSYYLGC